MLGDAVSKMWDKVYPRIHPEDPNSIRDVYIGNDRLRPKNDKENYPETLAEAVRKLYYWLGINFDDNNKGIVADNEFKYGPYRTNPTDPSSEVHTIAGVLNGASDLLGHIGDMFDDDMFVPVSSAKGGYFVFSEEYPHGGFNTTGYLNNNDFKKI
jgi:hypothetical protein